MVEEWKKTRQEYPSGGHEGFMEWLLVRKFGDSGKLLFSVLLLFVMLYIGSDLLRILNFFKGIIVVALVVGLVSWFQYMKKRKNEKKLASRQRVIDQLKRKKSLTTPKFSHEELDFMLENIGCSNPAIRDHLIYHLFYKGFSASLFSLEQVHYIAEKALRDDILYYRIEDRGDDQAIFKRSFSLLLYSLIIAYDGNEESVYDGFLSKDERNWLFKQSSEYFFKEWDYRDFVKGNGWAHALAHGADFLTNAVWHPSFQKELWHALFDSVFVAINKVEGTFRDGEEERLAHIFVEGILKDYESFFSFLVKVDRVVKRLKKLPSKEYVKQITGIQKLVLAVKEELAERDKLSQEELTYFEEKYSSIQ